MSVAKQIVGEDAEASSVTPHARDVRVAITVCSRGRPTELGLCIDSLLKQDVPAGVKPLIVVVENNEEPEYAGLFQDLKDAVGDPWEMHCCHEPRLGIPQARNRCLDIALAHDPDWIAFIDDETVAPDWLQKMIRATAEMDCDVFQGPVRYRYPNTMPKWLVAKGVTPRSRGLALPTAYTNNTLMKSHIASPDGLGLRFDEAMRFSGGSDSDYFLRAADLGARIRWVDDAFVDEVVTPTRLSLRWQLMRALRVAANASVIHRKRRGGLSAWQRYAPKSLSRMVFGIVILPLGGLLVPFNARTGQRYLFKAGKSFASGVGGIMGLLQVSPQPYRDMS